MSALAVTCHYSAIVFLGACFLGSIMLLWREQAVVIGRLGVSLLLPGGAFAYFYFTHARYRPLEGYLSRLLLAADAKRKDESFRAAKCAKLLEPF